MEKCFTKDFIFNWLKAISRKKMNSKLKNSSSLKGVTFGSAVLISVGEPSIFLHHPETKQPTHDTRHNSCRCGLKRNYVFSLGTFMGEDGLGVLVNLS